MGFRFTLASVLRVRDSIEKREELALQRVQFEILRVQQRVEGISAEIARMQIESDRAIALPAPAYRLQDILSEMKAAIEARQSLIDSLVPLEQEKERRMTAYQEAHAGRQLLTDMLIEQRASYSLEQVRRQQKFLDEVFSSRSSRD